MRSGAGRKVRRLLRPNMERKQAAGEVNQCASWRPPMGSCWFLVTRSLQYKGCIPEARSELRSFTKWGVRSKLPYKFLREWLLKGWLKRQICTEVSRGDLSSLTLALGNETSLLRIRHPQGLGLSSYYSWGPGKTNKQNLQPSIGLKGPWIGSAARPSRNGCKWSLGKYTFDTGLGEFPQFRFQ